ncbi:MAG: VOC family protein [Mesorhizobium sp.]|nr:VOC family protein [Mesorhizobium sp.]
MKLKLNHVAVAGDDALALAKFYREVIGLEPMHTPAAQTEHIDPDSYKWLRIGDSELHVVQKDDTMAPRLALNIDPLAAHFAFEAESKEHIREISERLTAAGVKWMDWSKHGIPGKEQIFMVDPGGNLVEFQLGSKGGGSGY